MNSINQYHISRLTERLEDRCKALQQELVLRTPRRHLLPQLELLELLLETIIHQAGHTQRTQSYGATLATLRSTLVPKPKREKPAVAPLKKLTGTRRARPLLRVVR